MTGTETMETWGHSDNVECQKGQEAGHTGKQGLGLTSRKAEMCARVSAVIPDHSGWCPWLTCQVISSFPRAPSENPDVGSQLGLRKSKQRANQSWPVLFPPC